FISLFFFYSHSAPRSPHSFPTRRSSDLTVPDLLKGNQPLTWRVRATSTDGVGPWSATRSVVLRVFTTIGNLPASDALGTAVDVRSEEHTSELQSLRHLVCRLLLEKKKKK